METTLNQTCISNMDKQEEEEGTILIEEEVVVVDLIASHYIHNLIATMATILDPSLTTIISHHNISYRIKKEYILVFSATFVSKWDIWPLIAIIGCRGGARNFYLRGPNCSTNIFIKTSHIHIYTCFFIIYTFFLFDKLYIYIYTHTKKKKKRA